MVRELFNIQTIPRGHKETELENELIEDILKGKDYYGILGISKSATPDKIKKAYKKKCIKVHPDKNKHAKAAEAFKEL